MAGRLWHRVRQFFGAVRPRVTAADRAEAYDWLTDGQQQLFESMMLRDQQHGIIVFRRVRASTPRNDPALFAAALLHDCGKGQVTLWQRVGHVCLGGRLSSLEARIAHESGAGWRRAMYRLRYHPDIGADLVASAGSDSETVRLIRAQEHHPADERLALLQAADNL
jgi:hypothetical protein